jgi:NAD(P)-dependent dehydrogenase (short-subunit alcohol dehydrogenase family)
MQHDLHDLDVVVTGGAGALGSAIVAHLLDRGARVHVPWFGDPPRAGHERLHAAEVDLRSEQAVERFYRGLPRVWASIHAAGGFAMAPITETSRADFDAMLALNGTTCFLCCREAVRAMRSNGGPDRGRIVNVAARPVERPVGGMVAYAASKSVVASITQSLAEETKADGILVNAVLPSLIDTPANRAAMPSAEHASWPKPAELAAAIAYLASPINRLTTGALVPVYGRV